MITKLINTFALVIVAALLSGPALALCCHGSVCENGACKWEEDRNFNDPWPVDKPVKTLARPFSSLPSSRDMQDAKRRDTLLSNCRYFGTAEFPEKCAIEGKASKWCIYNAYLGGAHTIENHDTGRHFMSYDPKSFERIYGKDEDGCP